MTLTTLPSPSAMRPGSLGSCLMRSHSRYPRGLSVSALRSPSDRGDMPPATSICIIKDVPERGSPETMVIIFAAADYMTECVGRNRLAEASAGLFRLQ